MYKYLSKWTRLAALAAVVACVALLAVACNGDDASTATSAPTVTRTQGQTTATPTATLAPGQTPVATSTPTATARPLTTPTTTPVPPLGPAAVNLLSAGNFVILTKSGITNVPTSAITGNIGTSPVTGAAIAGLGCAEVTGIIYTVDAAGPACRVTNDALLTGAIGNMQTAYTDAAGRTSPNFTELGAGNIGGMTLAPGLYKWGTGVTIPAAGVTLSGGANDVWIFQIAQDLTVANGAIVTLSGGAQAKNIFWQVGGEATLGTTVQFKGIILSQTLVSMNTGATLLGRAFAHTEVTLNQNTVTKPD